MCATVLAGVYERNVNNNRSTRQGLSEGGNDRAPGRNTEQNSGDGDGDGGGVCVLPFLGFWGYSLAGGVVFSISLLLILFVMLLVALLPQV